VFKIKHNIKDTTHFDSKTENILIPDSAVGAATGWTVQSSSPNRCKRFFLFSKTIQTSSRAHPASYSTNTRVLYRGKNGRATNSTSLPKVEVKNEWSYTSALHIWDDTLKYTIT
jgi:hypothetical protein